VLFPRKVARRRGGAFALLAVAVVAGGLSVAPVAAQADPPGVTPSDVTVSLAPGGTTTVTKTVHTPTVPPKPDVVFLADTTGSMGGAIANVRTNAADILSAVSAAQPTAQFGVAQYKDVGDTPLFAVDQNLTANAADVQTGINSWSAGGGGDFPESGLNALFQLANGAVSFRGGGTRIVVIFGDAPSHDPSAGHSLADAIGALQAAHIRVVAVNVGVPGAGLNTGGQIKAVTDATGGVFLDNVASSDVSTAILAGIQAIKVTVAPHVVSCTGPVSLTYSPPSVTVDSGADAVFTESIGVPGNVPPGTYHCTVDFYVDGASQGFIQNLTVVVPGLSINNVTVNESAGSATFTVNLSPASTVPVTVNYATSNGTAVAGLDYTGTAGSLSFAAGQTSKTISVPIIDDTIDELTETFNVTLSGVSGAALVVPVGTGTILDNDRNGTFSCTSTVLKVGPLTSTTANPANVPCADDSTTLAQITLTSGLVNVQSKTLTAQTNLTPDNQNTAPAVGDSATAKAQVEYAKIVIGGLTTIEIGVIQANASATCVNGPGGLVPSFAGSSSIAYLKINGVSVTVGSAPLTIALVVGSLKLNGTTTTATGITQEAVALHTVLTDVVLGQAHADIEGTAVHPSANPCQV
jgi:hypothetical protein